MEGREDYCLHEHPLICNDDQQEDWCCSACGLPLLLSPSYRCNIEECNFFLHKACKQLPQELKSYVASNGGLYSLTLGVKPPNEAWTCDACGKLCENLIAYHSTQFLGRPGYRLLHLSTEIVHVDALCAFPLEIKSKHDSHEHELVAMRREAQLLCDICKRKHEGFFFSCKECDFWVHKDCAVLPRVIEINSHNGPLTFSYSFLPWINWTLGRTQCLICKEKFTRTTAIYYCGHCANVVHLHCGKSKIKNSEHNPPVQFPLEEADKSLFIHKMLEKKGFIEKNNDEDEKSSTEKYHNHPLSFHDVVDKDSSSNSLCDACILPINSPPYYRCEKPGCDFLLHQHCTNLPSSLIANEYTFEEINVGASRFSLSALKLKVDGLLSPFFCSLGGYISNGFRYEDKLATVDLQCLAAPRTIKHQLHHKHHILYSMLHSTGRLPCVCCSWPGSMFDTLLVYRCASCNFEIHCGCAFLPATVSHKFDKHRLQLSSGTNVNGKYFFCEICEGDVDTKYWFYHCEKCEHLFHVNCLPSVGLLSKIKFGGIVEIPDHHHPVTFTRMLEIGNQRCWKCKDVIQGLVDVMAFQCSKCCYWCHFLCALPEMKKLRIGKYLKVTHTAGLPLEEEEEEDDEEEKLG